MSYKEKLKNIQTLEQLFDFREELKKELEQYSSANNESAALTDIEKCQEINFWIDRVTHRIKFLEIQGAHLDKIEITK